MNEPATDAVRLPKMTHYRTVEAAREAIIRDIQAAA